MASSIACHFTVTGTKFDPDQFSDRVGLTPTDTWREGDRVGDSLIRRKHSGWRCSIPRRDTTSLENIVKELLVELSPYADAIRQECSRLVLKAELACIVHVGSPTPSAHFGKETLDAIARLGAEIDVDLYLEASDLDV